MYSHIHSEETLTQLSITIAWACPFNRHSLETIYCTKPLDACSNFTLVAVIQDLDQKQFREEGLFLANNSYVTVCHFREILAGNQEAGHITSTVESREKWIVPILPVCLVPN